MKAHWLDRRLEERLETRLMGNVIRIDARTLIELNKLRNELTGKDHSLFEASLIAEETGEVIV